MKLNEFKVNVLELYKLSNSSFDIVLCFGTIYHLKDIKDHLKCIEEVKRVCKNDGIMFFAFINNDMVITTETMCYQPSFLKSDQYNQETFKVNDFPFVFTTIDQARELLQKSELTIIDRKSVV